jgi:hypothetical protein
VDKAISKRVLQNIYDYGEANMKQTLIDGLYLEKTSLNIPALKRIKHTSITDMTTIVRADGRWINKPDAFCGWDIWFDDNGCIIFEANLPDIRQVKEWI